MSLVGVKEWTNLGLEYILIKDFLFLYQEAKKELILLEIYET